MPDPDDNQQRGMLRLGRNDATFFRPLWRRLAVVAFLAAWFCWELLYTHDQTWMLIVAALEAYAVWMFLIRFDAGKPPEDGSTGPDRG